ncbi:MAG: hypothetical protein J6A88_03105 [Oscillospiraceae bacterium]|nr:hypothetical protein [Oscillospiraceae bacterium]
MKTILSILLVICLGLTVFVGCEAPVIDDQNPGTTLPTGSSEPTGSNGGTESTGSTESSGYTESTEVTNPSEGSGNTQTTEPTQGTPGPDSQLKGEPITEAQFNALTTNSPTNYSYSETRTYNGKTQVITMLINGNEFLETITENGVTTRKLLGILKDGTIKNYEYNETTGKWETSHTGKTINFPLKGFPMPLSAFTYNETAGMYQFTMTDGSKSAEIQLMFKDGQLIFLGQIDGANEDMVFFYDYGKTVIPVPAESDIVEKNNNTQTGTSDKH